MKETVEFLLSVVSQNVPQAVQMFTQIVDPMGAIELGRIDRQRTTAFVSDSHAVLDIVSNGDAHCLLGIDVGLKDNSRRMFYFTLDDIGQVIADVDLNDYEELPGTKMAISELLWTPITETKTVVSGKAVRAVFHYFLPNPERTKCRYVGIQRLCWP